MTFGCFWLSLVVSQVLIVIQEGSFGSLGNFGGLLGG